MTAGIGRNCEKMTKTRRAVQALILLCLWAFSITDAYAAATTADSSPETADIPQNAPGFDEKNQAAVDQQNQLAAAQNAATPPVIPIPAWATTKITAPNGMMSVTVSTQKSGKYTNITVAYYNAYTKLTSTCTWNTGNPDVISQKVVDQNGKTTYNQSFDYNANPSGWKNVFQTMHNYLMTAATWTSPSGKKYRDKLQSTGAAMMKVKNWVVFS